MTIYRGIGDDTVIAFAFIACPQLVVVKEKRKLICDYGSMKRKYRLDLNTCCFLKQGFNLKTELTDYSDVISSGFVDI